MADQNYGLLLTAAQAALEVGNRESARRMVEQVLAEEPYTAEAWYLLSFSVERWEDQVACIQNALAADPGHATAQARQEELEAQRFTATVGRREATVPLLAEVHAEAMRRYFTESRLEPAGDPLDDPRQCPYCGAVNPMANSRCSRCKREIVFAQPKAETPSPSLKTATILAGSAAILGLFEVGTPGLWQWFHSGLHSGLALAAGAALDTNLVKLLFGPIGREGYLDDRTALALVILGIVRIAAIGVAWFGAYHRWRWGYFAGSAVSLADVAYQVTLGATELAGRAPAIFAGVLSFAALVLLIGPSADDFSVVKVRVAVEADRRLKTADAFFRKGKQYKEAGLWALAVANWRMAVGNAPQRAEYLRWLAVGYMQLERYDRALPILQEAQRQVPDNPELDELLSLVQDMLAEEKRKARAKIIEPLWTDSAVDQNG